jgi:Uma2 family endonuclease
VNPPANWLHENRIRRLHLAVLKALPKDWAAYAGAGFLVGGEHIVPDLTVVESELPDVEQQWGEAPVRLVVEVESATTKHKDRKLKAEAYARQGIDVYWRVEKDGKVHVYSQPQPDGTWDDIRTVRPGETLTLTEPFPIDVSPADWI